MAQNEKEIQKFKGIRAYSYSKWISSSSSFFPSYRLRCRRSFAVFETALPNISLSYLLLNHRLNAIYQSIHSLLNCSVHTHIERNSEREEKIFASQLNPPPRSTYTHCTTNSIELATKAGDLYPRNMFILHAFIHRMPFLHFFRLYQIFVYSSSKYLHDI